MGAQASKPAAPSSSTPSAPAAADDKISLSQSMLNKISSATGGAVGGDSSSSTTSASSSLPSQQQSQSSSSSSSSSSPLNDLLPHPRQSHLDSSVRSQISSELTRLRKQETAVQEEIRRKLEEENLAVEKGPSGSTSSKSSSGKDGARTSSSLEAELASVRQRIQRHDEGRKLVESSSPMVKEAREKVVKCYRDKEGRTLDCWREAREFANAVERAERELVGKLSA